MIGWGLPLFILETAIFFIEDGIKVLVACLIGLGTKVHIVVRKYAHNLQFVEDDELPTKSIDRVNTH